MRGASGGSEVSRHEVDGCNYPLPCSVSGTGGSTGLRFRLFSASEGCERFYCKHMQTIRAGRRTVLRSHLINEQGTRCDCIGTFPTGPECSILEQIVPLAARTVTALWDFSCLMTNGCIGNATGCERGTSRSLSDHGAQSPDRFGKHQKFISVKVQGYRSIGKVEFSAIAEHHL